MRVSFLRRLLLWRVVTIAVTVVICCCCWHWCHFGRSSCSSCSQFSWRSTWRWWWCSLDRWIITIVDNDDIILIFQHWGLCYPTILFIITWWSPIRRCRWRIIIYFCRSFPWWRSFSCRWQRWWRWSCSSCRRGRQGPRWWRTSSTTFRGRRWLFCAWLHLFHKRTTRYTRYVEKCVSDVAYLFRWQALECWEHQCSLLLQTLKIIMTRWSGLISAAVWRESSSNAIIGSNAIYHVRFCSTSNEILEIFFCGKETPFSSSPAEAKASSLQYLAAALPTYYLHLLDRRDSRVEAA